jgi:hypothetical protein
MILEDLRNISVSTRTDFASLLRHQLWQLSIEQQETALPAEQIA